MIFLEIGIQSDLNEKKGLFQLFYTQTAENAKM